MNGRSSVVAVGLTLVLAAVCAGDAFAQRGQTVDPRTAKKLIAVQEALQAEQFDEALQMLNSFRPEKMKKHPAALVYQARAYVYLNQEKYDEALDSYHKAIEQDALPERTQLNILFTIGQLYMRMDEYGKAIDAFERWFKEGAEAEEPIEPNASAYYTLAVAYYQDDRQDEALKPAQKAVDMTPEPREGWLNLLLAIRMGRKEYKEALPLLETLVSSFPRKTYYVQLAAVYAELDKDKESLAVQQLAYAQGLLTTHRELTRLAQLYLFNDLPYRGALVLEKGLEDKHIDSESKSWRLLGNAWLASREYDRALDPLQRAAELADDGEMYVRVGQVRIQREEWQEAVDALEKAIEKGGLEIPGQAYLLIGIARYNQKKMGSARAAFVKARTDEKAKSAAETWLKYLDREQASRPQQEQG